MGLPFEIRETQATYANIGKAVGLTRENSEMRDFKLDNTALPRFDSIRLGLWSFAILTDSDSVDSTIQTIQPSDSYNSDSNDSVMPIRAIPIRTILAIRTIQQRNLSRGAFSQFREIYVLHKTFENVDGFGVTQSKN